MSEPVRIGELLPDFLSDLRKRCGARDVENGTRETMGAQVKTAPAARQRCDSGASPTVKESTDG